MGNMYWLKFQTMLNSLLNKFEFQQFLKIKFWKSEKHAKVS